MSIITKEERIGMEVTNNQGYVMKCIEYNSAKDMYVEFQDEYHHIVHCRWDRFIRGNVRNPIYQNRIGLTSVNWQGYKMKIIEYKEARNIIVEFQDDYKYKTHCCWREFENGSVTNYMAPTVFDIGIVGDKYPVSINKKNTNEYKLWFGILQRCYDEKYHEKQPTYINCSVCEEWKYFPNFVDWLNTQSNYKNLSNDISRICIDKDILVKGNKIYSPETCCVVYQYINNLFVKNDAKRGKYPIGVYLRKSDNKFIAQISITKNKNKKRIFIGAFNTPKEAFYAYKIEKENLIKKVAKEEFDKGNITEKCCDAMMNYEVEITD